MQNSAEFDINAILLKYSVGCSKMNYKEMELDSLFLRLSLLSTQEIVAENISLNIRSNNKKIGIST